MTYQSNVEQIHLILELYEQLIVSTKIQSYLHRLIKLHKMLSFRLQKNLSRHNCLIIDHTNNLHFYED